MIKLENDLGLLLDWFSKNGMIANPEKFQNIFLGLKDVRCLRLNIEGKKLPITDTVKLRGIQIDADIQIYINLMQIYINFWEFLTWIVWLLSQLNSSWKEDS